MKIIPNSLISYLGMAMIPLAFSHCVIFQILLIPFERELEWGGALLEVPRLLMPIPSASASFGLIDSTGKVVWPLSPSWISEYREGLSATGQCDIKGSQCKYGYRDKNLNWKIAPQFSQPPGDYSDGYAMIPRPPFRNSEGYGFIDRSGKFAFQGMRWVEARDFQFGYARIALRRAGKDKSGSNTYHWGWIDKHGKVLDFEEPPLPLTPSIHPPNTWIREGMVPCPALAESGEIRWGYKNLTGDWVIEPIYLSVHPFYFGKAFVQVEKGFDMSIFVNDQFEFIDKTGKNLYPGSRFQFIYPPNHRGLGHISYVPEPGKTTGRSVLYNWKTGAISDFSITSIFYRSVLWEDSLYPAGRWDDTQSRFTGGYYDENFRMVISETKEGYTISQGESFSEGQAFVAFFRRDDSKRTTKYGMIDRSGKLMFYYDDKAIRYPPPYLRDGRVLIYVVK